MQATKRMVLRSLRGCSEVAIGTDYGETRAKRPYDQIADTTGTLPLADLYFDLKPTSRNLGEINHDALIHGRKQQVVTNASGGIDLYRIGDAVSSRNVHTSMLDALRLLKDFQRAIHFRASS